MSLDDAYTKRYKIRLMGTGNATTVATIPPLVIQKEARRRGITIAEFVKRFGVEAAFNSFEGVHYTFVEIDNNPKQEPMPARGKPAEKKLETSFDDLRQKLGGK
jgi:hypothetical protein